MRRLKLTGKYLKTRRQRIFAGFGASLLIFSAVLTMPVVEWLTAKQYELDARTLAVVGEANEKLADKLVYNKAENLYQFNADAKKPEGNDPAAIAQQLAKKQKNVTGDTSKKDLYSLDLSPNAKEGMTIYDNNSGLSFKMIPQFDKKTGRKVQDRLVYPLNDGAKAIYTVKNNGLKEDIVYTEAPESGEASFAYTLELPDTLEAKLQDDGSLGLYSADPALFGDITFGSDEDQEKVESARQNAQKDYLVFSVPRPVIVAENGKTGDAFAWFKLDGDTLTVKARYLNTIDGVFSIDPSVVITSAGDFASGNNEGNIEFDSGSIRRGGLTGGTIGSWASTTSFTTARSDHTSVAYNGYLYVIGGFDGGSSISNVQYAPINANGTIGTWTATTSLTTARNNLSSVAYNGYLYIIGGYGGSFLNDVQYAPINANGTIGTWTATTSLTTARSDHTSVAYNGYLYVIGGYDGGSSISNVQYAPINANGTIGTWTATTSLTTARDNHTTVTYNGYLYVIGGYSIGMSSDVQYAPINANGTIGTWTATTSLTTARSAHVSIAYNGYLYIMGGSTGTGYSSDVQYAPINANGTIGTWTATTSLTTARGGLGSVVYNGYIYTAGGYTGSNQTNDVQYAKIDPPGVTGEYGTTTSFTSIRDSHTSVAYNGYLYILGGKAKKYLNDVQYAPINANGTIGTWTATTSFTTTRALHTSVAYNGYLYILGGYDGRNILNDVQYAPINANGTIGTWTATTSFTTARQANTSVAYNGYIYVIGGFDGNSVLNDVQYAPINANGTIGTWTATTSFTTARQAHASFAYNGYLYILGGFASSAVSHNQYAPINANGTIGSWTTTTSLTSSRFGHTVVVDGGHVYTLGGSPSGTVLNTVQYAPINANGTIGSWTTTVSLTVARRDHTSVTYNGYIYAIGGFDGSSQLNDVQYARIENGGPGTTSSWTATTTLTGSRFRHTSVTYNGYIYAIGGFDGSSYLNSVLYAPLNDNGTVGSWSATTSFPTARRYHTSAVYNGYLYVLGGEDSVENILSDVRYASINSNGTLGSWNSTSSMPQGLRQHATEVRDGYIYVMGGSNGSSYQNAVVYAPINVNGTIGSWSSTSSFTTPRIFHTSAIAGDYIYIFGGAGNPGYSYYSDVQYAPINSNGTLGTWNYTTALDGGRTYNGTVVSNGYVYVVGGNQFDSYTSNVSYAAINNNGTLGQWQTTASLPSSRAFHTSVEYNGYIYAIGGQTTNLVSYASLNSIARKGKYSKLIDLGSPVNVSNVVFSGLLGDGTMTVRAADMNGQFGSTHEATTCMNLTQARYLFIMIDFDDVRRATFADSLMTAANMQDITAEYLSGSAVDPAKRLRGGKYFDTTGALQNLDTQKLEEASGSCS